MPVRTGLRVQVLAIVVFAAIPVGFYFTTIKGDTQSERATDPGYIVAFSSTEAEHTRLWLVLNPGQPGRDEDLPPSIDLSYRIDNPVDETINVGYVFANSAAEMLQSCSDQELSIRGKEFNDLPYAAREAIVSGFGNESSTRAARRSELDISMEVVNHVYTVVEVAADVDETYTTEGSDGTESEGRRASATHTCALTGSDRLWQRTSAGIRLTTPSAFFAAPSTEDNWLAGYSWVDVSTDDNFYFLRGTIDPITSEPGVSRFSLADDDLSTRDDLDVMQGRQLAALFSNYETENSRNIRFVIWGALIGVPLTLVFQLLVNGLTNPTSRSS